MCNKMDELSIILSEMSHKDKYHVILYTWKLKQNKTTQNPQVHTEKRWVGLAKGWVGMADWEK